MWLVYFYFVNFSKIVVPHKDDSARREGSRPRRGARGGYSGNGRQFDRHSGTHRDTDKKVNQGWGNGADATSGENAEGEVNAEETTADVSPVEKAEPEEVIKTLDEYLAEKAAATKITRALPEARKPDQSKWSQSKPLQKEEVGDFFSVAKEKSKKSAVAKPAATKQQVDIQQTFTNKPVATDSYRDSNRGGGRGGKNKGTQQMRGAPRQSRANAPNVNDSNAFPVLA